MSCTSSCTCGGNQNCYNGIKIECLNIKEGDILDDVIGKIGDFICEKGFDAQGIDHISFLESTGDPVNVAGQPGETDTYVMWADEGETVNLGSFIILNGVEGITEVLYSDVAWVDPVNGDDTTGEAGRFDAPYKTINAAYSATPNVFIRAGQYTDSIVVENTASFYFDSGAQFTAGGFTVTASGICTVRGNATFTDKSRPVVVQSAGVMDMEFDWVNNTTKAYEIKDDNSKLTMKFNWGISEGLDSALFGTCRDNSTTNIYVKYYLKSPYSISYFRQSSTSEFSGSYYLECPNIEVIGGGSLINAKAAFLLDKVGRCDIRVKGNIRYTGGDILSQGVVHLINTYQQDTKITIDGDVNAGKMLGLVSSTGANNFDITFLGNLITERNPINIPLPTTGNFGQVKFKNSYVEGLEMIIGAGRKVTFDNCSVYCITDSGRNINFSDGDPDATTVYAYNSYFEVEGAGGELALQTVGGFPITIGFVNSVSNKALGAGLIDAWSGLTVEPTFEVVKY